LKIDNLIISIPVDFVFYNHCNRFVLHFLLSYSDTYNCCYSMTMSVCSATEELRLHLYCAQELNNSAAMCFEKGQYERATTTLHDSLKLLIAMKHKQGLQNHPICGCCRIGGSGELDDASLAYCDHPCTLDGCIAFSEQTAFLIHNYNEETTATTTPSPEKGTVGRSLRRSFSHISNCQTTAAATADANTTTTPSQENNHNNSTKKRRLSRCSSIDVSNNEFSKNSNSSSSTILASTAPKANKLQGYVYRKPIRVPLEGFSHCHRGYTSLLAVIVFNLAIAHHLNVMDEDPEEDKTSSDAKFENIVFLYKLCLELIRQSSPLASQSSDKSSIRCEMIIRNNLSQLFRMNGETSKQQTESLQRLLSSYMVLIERGTRESGSTGSSSYWDENRWFASRAHKGGDEMVEGVLKNLDPILRKEVCADAA